MKKYSIRPNKWIIVILFVCLIAACFLLFNKPHVRIKHTPPVVLIVLSLWGLFQEWRTVTLDERVVVVQYYPFFIKRKISLDRIESVEYVVRKYQPYMVVSLQGCPAFDESKCKSVGLYAIAHPVGAIVMRCTEADYNECLSVLNTQRGIVSVKKD